MAYPTNPIYKFIKHPISGDNGGILLYKDGKTYSIPLNDENTDYQAYLDWVAEGNTAEAAD
tara:strand:+ start:626 stop:808 length:183 start_codon:yes stop_codon:yes gene_type:complete